MKFYEDVLKNFSQKMSTAERSCLTTKFKIKDNKCYLCAEKTCSQNDAFEVIHKTIAMKCFDLFVKFGALIRGLGANSNVHIRQTSIQAQQMPSS